MRSSSLLWVGIGVASLCVLCSVTSVLVVFLGGVRFADDTLDPPRSTSTTASTTSTIPTGDTPGLFPGMPGFRPSGRGKTIPAPAFEGAPRGLWWAPRLNGTELRCRVVVFFTDGDYAEGPRPGGPYVVDLEGQRQQNGTTGVGTFSVDGDAITLEHDGFKSTEPLSNRRALPHRRRRAALARVTS